MKFELPALPYPEEALEPAISAKTLHFHHDKHHAAYVEKTNVLIQGTRFENEPLEYIVRHADGAIFNNAAQAWNHEFYFIQFTPERGILPKGKLLEKIEKNWGTFEHFKEKFVLEGVNQFGSGWVWLVKNANDDLEIIKTSNAGTPLTLDNCTPILTFDVWEHAYYLDFQNRRADALNALWDVVDWRIVEKRLG